MRITILPEPCGRLLAHPMYAREDGERCRAENRCANCTPLANRMLAIGWAWSEGYEYTWVDCLAWNLTLAALLTSAAARASP